MAGFDELKGRAAGFAEKAGQLAKDNSAKIVTGIEKTGDFVDQKTGGKYADKVDGVQDGANKLLNKLKGNDNA